MKQKGIAPIVIILIIIGVLLAGGGVYFTKHRLFAKKESPPVTPTTTSTTTATSIATSTADISTWKTYRNERYGFEFKYPSDWELVVAQPSELTITHEIHGQKDNKVLAWGQIYIVINNEPLPAFEKEKGDQMIEIDGVEGIRKNYIIEGIGESVDIKNRDRLYYISLNYRKGLNNIGETYYRQTFDQILSTFKFTK